MKGYWYIHALSIIVSVLIAKGNYYLIFLIYLCWIIFLYVFSHLKIHIIIMTFIFFSLSLIYYSQTELTNINENYLKKDQFIGKIKSPLDLTEEKIEFTFRDEVIESPILVKLFTETKFSETVINKLKYGAKCKLQGTLQIPNKATNPAEFDYRRYLQLKGINYVLIISEEVNINCHGEGLLQFIYGFRQMMMQLVNERLSPATSQWVNALIFGDRSLIDTKAIDVFQQWGLSHILAISGLHTGIIIGIVYFLLVKLLITTRENAHLIIIVFLPLFALTSGGQPSVWRASLTVLFLLLLTRLNLNYRLLDIFSIVFILLVVTNPNIIFQIGFQFSFLVTFGLILSTHILKRSHSRLYQGFLISFVAQMIILPLQLHYFYTFQPLSILLNMIVVPYFSLFVIPLSFLLVVFMFTPKIMTIFFDFILGQVNDLFLSFLYMIHDTLNYPLLMGDLSFHYFIIYYILFFLFMKRVEQLQLKRAFMTGCFLVTFLIVLALRPYFSPVGIVTMLDIGQGDAFIVELPYRRGVFLIDSGATVSFPDFAPTDYEYNSIIKPYLNKRSIYEIDAVFLSHEHVDHYGSLPYMITDKEVKSVIVSPYFEWEESLKEVLKQNGIPIKIAQSNKRITINNHDFYILAPNKNLHSANDNSLVIYTLFGNQSWLFTGDIEKRAENELINRFSKLNVDILKVAHHGSKTSTQKQFLQKVNAKKALISVGENNMYNHPANDVIQALKEEKVKIYRTDEDGAVQYFYSDNEMFFKTFINEK